MQKIDKSFRLKIVILHIVSIKKFVHQIRICYEIPYLCVF